MAAETRLIKFRRVESLPQPVDSRTLYFVEKKEGLNIVKETIKNTIVGWEIIVKENK